MDLPAENKAIYKKVFVILSILVGLVVNLFLVQTVIRLGTKAAVSTVKFTFNPTSANFPPDNNFVLTLDPTGQSITFVQAQIHFDPQELQLTNDITLGSVLVPPPGTDIAFTPYATANSTGIIDITLVQKSGSSAPTQPFEIASLPFTYIGTGELAETDLTIVDEATQVVNSASEDLPILSEFASISLSHSPSKKIEPKGILAKAVLQNFQGRCEDMNIDTAIGCIPYTDTNAIAKFFLVWGVGIAGGIALLLIVYASYMIMTSQGDPKHMQSGRELLNAAILGLMMIVFASFILKVIGVDVLGILGF